MALGGAGSAIAPARGGLRLVRPSPAPVAVPDLDGDQRAVVDRVARPGHGPLAVLAGPGTGKTTTLVEAVAARVEAGTAPSAILTLTFSRRAAADLRARIARRIARTTAGQTVWTFHAFAYALLRAQPEVADGLRLLSGPEQEQTVAELLRGDSEVGSVVWPPHLAAAVATEGFVDEVRDVLARARARGISPAELAAGGHPAWPAAGAFLAEYLNVLALSGAVDYPELVSRAVELAASPEGMAALRRRFSLVVVDEYQDTDPSQEALLAALAGDGRDLVVVGDPDQAIYGFRGSDATALSRFPDRFRTATGGRAPVLALRTCRRSGAVLLAASREVARRLPGSSGGLGAAMADHRALRPAPGQPPGVVEVVTVATAAAQWALVADLLRREHLEEGTPWSSMAVLVRSATRSMPAARRGLVAAGVPVTVAGDEIPLALDPACRPLLTALEVVTSPGPLDPGVAELLVTSPLGGLDPVGLRRLGRDLRAEDRAGAPDALGVARPSGELLAQALGQPGALASLPGPQAAAAGRLAALLAGARAVADAGGSAHEVLWALWQGSDWPARLLRASRAGGPGAVAADRDLDAVVALMDTAARVQARGDRTTAASFAARLAGQRIPADPLEESDVAGGAVRLLTAHRSKGLEWDVVAVVDVAEDVWPDLRPRGSLLGADRLAALRDTQGDALPPGPSVGSLLAEERRLFYVAVTRARRRVLVTAVAAAADDGTRPSRFLDELGVMVADQPVGVARPLSLPAVVAELRGVAADPAATPALRAAAVAQLARLAGATQDGRALVPAAHPDRWWGSWALTDPARPLVADGQAPRVSPSDVAALADCRLAWFLTRRVGAGRDSGTALAFGTALHAVAHALVTGEVRADDEQSALAALAEVWPRLGFEAPWRADAEWQEATAAVHRLLAWHQEMAAQGRRPVASEEPLDAVLPAPGAPGLQVRGRADRVDVDAGGAAHLVDFKTSKTPTSGAGTTAHPQLLLYQAVVAAGGLDLATGPLPPLAGAELVQLRHSARGTDRPKVTQQAPVDGADPAVADLVAAAVDTLARENLFATPSAACERCPVVAACPAHLRGGGVVV